MQIQSINAVNVDANWVMLANPGQSAQEWHTVSQCERLNLQPLVSSPFHQAMSSGSHSQVYVCYRLSFSTIRFGYLWSSITYVDYEKTQTVGVS